ncbi:MAG: hypothetical protein ACYDAO_10265 [Thermoplasmataceae archaeon]
MKNIKKIRITAFLLVAVFMITSLSSVYFSNSNTLGKVQGNTVSTFTTQSGCTLTYLGHG